MLLFVLAKIIKKRYENPDLFYKGLNITICNLVNSEQHKISSSINLEIVKNVFGELNVYLKGRYTITTLLQDKTISGGFITKKYKLVKKQIGGADITKTYIDYYDQALNKKATNEKKLENAKYNQLNTRILDILTKKINNTLKKQFLKSLTVLLYTTNTTEELKEPENVKLSEEIDLFLKNSLYKQINALPSEIPIFDYNNIMTSIKSMLMGVKLNEKVSEDFENTITNLLDLYKNWSATAGEVLYNSIKEYLDALYEIELYKEMQDTLA